MNSSNRKTATRRGGLGQKYPRCHFEGSPRLRCMERNVFQNRDPYCGHKPCDGGRRQTQPRATPFESPIRFRTRPEGACRLAIFPVCNPNGIPSRSPGLDREAGLPWINDVQCINPNGVVGDSAIPPRVARSSQPWALGRNAFGIGKCPPRTLCRTIRASPRQPHAAPLAKPHRGNANNPVCRTMARLLPADRNVRAPVATVFPHRNQGSISMRYTRNPENPPVSAPVSMYSNAVVNDVTGAPAGSQVAGNESV